jgi:hypothetical protein
MSPDAKQKLAQTAPWVALIVALAGFGESYFARERARIEAQHAAASAAAHAKVDVTDEVDTRMVTLTASIAVLIERSRLLEKRIDDLHRGSGETHAIANEMLLPEPNMPAPIKKSRGERIHEQQSIYLKEAF